MQITAALSAHALLYAALSAVIGFQSESLSTLTRALHNRQQALSSGPRAGGRLLGRLTTESGLAVGAMLFFLGSLVSLCTLRESRVAEAELLRQVNSLRLAVPAIAPVGAGLQVILASFLLGALAPVWSGLD